MDNLWVDLDGDLVVESASYANSYIPIIRIINAYKEAGFIVTINKVDNFSDTSTK